MTSLYGLPGAEYLRLDIQSVIEAQLDDTGDEQTPYVIEEWNTHSSDHFLPEPSWVLEMISEYVADNEVSGDCAEAYADALSEPMVVSAMQGVLSMVASRIKYYMANKLIALHDVTWLNCVPYVDGKKLYETSEASS